MRPPPWLVMQPPPIEDLLEAIIGKRNLPISLDEMARASIDELSKHLSPVKVLRLKAAFMLNSALLAERMRKADKIRDASDVYNLYKDRFNDQEHFVSLLLNSKNQILREVIVSKGTLTASLVHPREVYSDAIRERAASIIVVHNHPSGDPAPSKEDCEITRRLKQTGDLIGIDLLDHVIVADSYVSMKERRLI